ncbi:MAG: hypothetical protein CMD32_02190 [Flavobacteriales bacterium]|nr:hypothetical protein [Flavobacteriales bacterium]
MKNKYLLVVAILFFYNNLFSQTIIDTESSLKKIDSTFHAFASFMGDKKTGNFDLSFLRADLTIGSRVKNDLLRLTFSHSSTKFNGNNFDKSTNLQFRWNKILNEDHSLFLFLQTGESARSFIDERTLFGVGLRQHLYKKDKNYFDIAVGPFYEYEAYPGYSFENIDYDPSSQKTTRISFNIFSSVKLFENVTSSTTIYSQWRYNDIGDVRVFGNQYIRFKINEKLSTYVRYVVRYRSINYIKRLKNDTDFMYGLEIDI